MLALAAILVIIFIQNFSFIKSPVGTYMDANGAMTLVFEKSGRLTIGSRAGSSVMINNRPWYGPASNQVTVTTWERSGKNIYIAIPGEEKRVPAFKIDGDDLIFDKTRLRHVQ